MGRRRPPAGTNPTAAPVTGRVHGRRSRPEVSVSSRRQYREVRMFVGRVLLAPADTVGRGERADGDTRGSSTVRSLLIGVFGH